jgi:hypothetical protein
MSDITLGFTGTRTALTRRQYNELQLVLNDEAIGYLHHGDCIGADATAHSEAVYYSIRTIVHPPADPKLRAWCRGDEIHDPKPYLQRNADIVAACDWLLAMPNGPEGKGSGTWWTINHADDIGRYVLIVYPDGSVDERTP